MLTSLYAPYRWLVYIALAAGLVAGVTLLVHRYNDGLREEGRQEIRIADKTAADQQVARNRELQRQAELHYTVQAATREKFFVTTVREVHDAAAPLAACAVPDSVRVRVNDAIACAVSDSAATCGTDGEVPAAAAPAGRGSSK